ncbi:MAG: YbaB/EbfC family nucleoid-associated protein, partial [Candidatus Hydrogenedentota bacterium]
FSRERTMIGMPGLMKELQKMQKKLASFQEELKSREFTASVGGGMVEIKARGTQEIFDVKIKKEALNPEDIEMLESMIITAVNSILKQIQEETAKGMNKITGGIPLPPGLL